MLKPRGLFMSVTEQFTFGILSDFESRKISRSEAAKLLNIDERSVSRKARRLREKGLLGLQHGNKCKSPINKTADEFKIRVVELVRQKYFDFDGKV
jgi:transposase